MKTKVYFSILVLISFISTLTAQDARLFENIWYLHDLIIDNVSHEPPMNEEVPLVTAVFFENGTLNTLECDGGTGMLEYMGSDSFLVLDLVYLLGECIQEESLAYSALYQDFWGGELGVLMTYQITQMSDTRTLLITNDQGNTARYENEMPLSVDEVDNQVLELYPNPVQEVLYVESNIGAGGKITIYNLSGQPMQSQELLEGAKTIDVHALASGLYFVSLEGREGQQQTKKIIKN